MFRRVAGVVAAGVFLVGCAAEPEAPSSPADPHAAHGDPHAAHGDPHAAHGGGATAPLIEIMAGLARDSHALHEALWVEDWARVEASARAIADHPRVPPDEMKRIQGALGHDFAAFVEADRRVHGASAALARAAGARDLDALLERLAEVEAGCVSCHVQFRERVRGQGLPGDDRPRRD